MCSSQDPTLGMMNLLHIEIPVSSKEIFVSCIQLHLGFHFRFTLENTKIYVSLTHVTVTKLTFKFHRFTVHFDWLSFFYTNSCTFIYNYVLVFLSDIKIT
jgi:hypothetical protein